MDSYAAFREIVKFGSISRAAEALGYSQSSVSHMLKVLEEELGCTLLTRDRNGVRLTPEGEHLLPLINDISNAQERLNEKVQAIQGLFIGKIRIATFPSAANRWLPYIIKGFHELHPHIEFELINGAYPEIENWVLSGIADFGFVRMPTSVPMHTRVLREEPFFAVLPENHKYAGEEKISMEMIVSEPFIWPDDRGENEIEPLLKKYGKMPDVLFTVPDIYALMTMVEVGLGVSIMPGLALENRTHIVKKPLDISETRKIGIALGERPSAAARAFSNYVRQWISEKYGCPSGKI